MLEIIISAHIIYCAITFQNILFLISLWTPASVFSLHNFNQKSNEKVHLRFINQLVFFVIVLQASIDI